MSAEKSGEEAKKNCGGAQPMDAGVGKLRYLFADEGIVMNRCIARSQAKSSLEPVFKQCCRPLHSSQYCTMHWKKAMLTRGTWKMGNWDPDTNHSSLPARELLDGQRKAERRYVAAVRRGDGPGLRWERRKRRFVCKIRNHLAMTPRLCIHSSVRAMCFAMLFRRNMTWA